MASIGTLIDDAEKIGAELVPSGALIERVVGALILHVEQLLGKELPALSDEALHLLPSAEAQAANQAQAAHADQLSQLQARTAELEDQLAQSKTGGKA